MPYRKILRILRRVAFFLVLIALLLHISRIFERKTLEGAWNYTLKVGGFANEPRDSFQVLGFGSSHMYCTMNPLYIYEQTGVRSYVLATRQQPVEATYYYVKEAFETQSPDVVILELYSYLFDKIPATEGIAHDSIDPFPAGLNKMQLISEMDTEDGKENYYLNMIKYHTRWKELQKSDFIDSYREETDPMHGFVFLTETAPNENTQLDYTSIAETPLDSENLEYLRKTIDLIKENGSEVLLLLAPYEIQDESGCVKAVHRFAEEEHVALLDMNLCYQEIGLNNAKDFYDPRHLNVFGSEKASLYLMEYLQKHFSITERTVDDAAQWQEDLQEYHSQKAG